jgi:hypothetical protein
VQYVILVKNATGTVLLNATYSASAQCSGTTCSVTPPVLLAAAGYGWNITAVNAAGVQSVSSPLIFTINLSSPAAAPTFQPPTK